VKLPVRSISRKSANTFEFKCVRNINVNAWQRRRLATAVARDVKQSLASSFSPLIVSNQARERLKTLSSETPGIYLRVVVNGGGCNGYLASFKLDEAPLAKDDLKILDDKGAVVVTDKISLGLIEGATIDYDSHIARSAFVVSSNPKATSQCGCKVSFGVG